MTSQARWGWAFFGALLPDVIAFYVWTHGDVVMSNKTPGQWALLVCASLVYASFAGFFSIAWKPESRWKAVWIGASFSTIAGVLIKNAPQLPQAVR
jgi:hypothetical protein